MPPELPSNQGENHDPAPGAAPPGPRVVDLQIERELQDSYLTYAMSTIMDRALPDARDGLKPSQRRILFAMYKLALWPGKKHIKCAKISGDTSGNYHPHGDAVIYPTLVNMGQNWRLRQTLIDPQGNFGSIAPDPPAAMRYTEARLTHAAVDMLKDLDLDTVDYQPNFDDRPGFDEPTVLPSMFPNLLVNGGVGIAVGMATSLAPNNPVEVLDAIIRTIDQPGIGLLDLMQDVKDERGEVLHRGIKGPDFPTGGMILGRRGIIEAYETGRGRVTLRGRVRVEPLEGAKDREQIVVEQLPYNLGLETLIERIKVAVEEDRITDIAEARNESNAKNPARVVIELKKGADAGVVEKQLYEYTPLQQTFSIQSIALVNRQPRTLSLREMIRCYIDHRVEVIRRRTAHLLNEARQKAHVLEGMIYAVTDIDEVIRLIRASRTRREAIDALMARRFRIAPSHPHAALIPPRLMDLLKAAQGAGGVLLTRLQAETIGNMRLIQLTGLEVEKLVGDYRELAAQIERHERVLATPQLVLDMIKGDCAAMKARFNSPRVCEVQESGGEDLNIASLIPVQDMAVTISHHGYAKRVALETYKQQGRGGKGIIAGTTKEDDYIEHVLAVSTHDDLLVFTDTGRVFKLKVFELPELPRQSKGRPLVNLLEFKVPEKAVAFLGVKNFEAGSEFLTFVSVGGIVKRTPLKDYRNVHKGGLIAVDIKEGDHLLDVTLTDGHSDVLLATAQGLAIRFDEQDVRVMGRGAAGVKGIELAPGDSVIGVVKIPMTTDPQGDPVTAAPDLAVLTITEKGYGKRTLVDEYRVAPENGKMRSQSRGGKGRVDIKTTDRNGPSVACLGVRGDDDIVVGTKQGQLVRMAAGGISVYGRGAQGVRIVTLNEGDGVTAASRVAGEPEANPDQPTPPV